MAVGRLARLVRRLEAKQAGFAVRVDECRSHPRQSGSPDEFLARLNGTSRTEAKQMIDTARRLKQCPTTAEAFESGELSVGEAAAISVAAVVDPTAEAALVAHAAKTHDLAGTRERANRVKVAARKGEDPAVRRSRLRAQRRWCEFDRDEMVATSSLWVPEDYALVRPVVDAYAQAVYERARRLGLRDPMEAYRADGVLAALAAAGEAIGITITLPTTTTPGTKVTAPPSR